VRVRASLGTLALAAGLLWPAAGPAPVACAAGDRAALVVDTGAEVQRFCVQLPDESVTGIELIELASDQYGLSYKLGFGGGAMCMLAGVGPTGDDCFEEYPNFWGYWRGAAGGWAWSSTGAADTEVTDGDVEGWTWGAGQDPETHPAPPPTAFSSVCPGGAGGGGEEAGGDEAGEGRDEPAADGSTTPAAAPAPAPTPSPGPVAVGPKDRDSHETTAEKKGAVSARVGPPTGPAGPIAAQDGLPPAADLRAGPVSDDRGPPAAGLVGITAALVMGVAGSVLVRRRKSANFSQSATSHVVNREKLRAR
jgi:hypothetical protein